MNITNESIPRSWPSGQNLIGNDSILVKAKQLQSVRPASSKTGKVSLCC